MTYTSNFGTAVYTAPDGTQIAVPDLTKFASIPDEFKNNPAYSLSYQIKDGERLDQISKRIYGQEDRFWIILLMNDMYDLSNQWPLNQEEFSAMLDIKYPFNSPSDIHHYADVDGNVVDPFVGAFRQGIAPEAFIAQADLAPITIQDYETKINEAKRNINILDPSLVDRLEDSMFSSFDNSERR